MRPAFVAMVTAAIVIAALIGMPGNASAQVVVIIGNGAAQPYYPPPFPYAYPRPFPNQNVVYGAPGYYPGYLGVGSGYYGAYYNGYNGYNGNGYHQPYQYGW